MRSEIFDNLEAMDPFGWPLGKVPHAVNILFVLSKQHGDACEPDLHKTVIFVL